MFCYRDKTRVHMFDFDSKTTVPLQCDALVFLNKAFVDRMSFGYRISDAYETNSVTVSINERVQIFQ